MKSTNNINLENLILSIITYVKEKGGYVTKTKLLKYLYLIDVEYYRETKQKLTNFDWIFYKFGPYTSQFEEIYKRLTSNKILVTKKTNFDYDAEILDVYENVELEKANIDINFRVSVRKILRRWAKERLPAMLDYVYFETEPMENARKLQPLDFTQISTIDEDERLVINYPKIKPAQLKAIREKIDQKVWKNTDNMKISELFPIDNYDEHYWETIDKLESQDDY